MTGVAAAVWCIKCGQAPVLVMTFERDGVLMHYGSCWNCVTYVADRARRDVEQIDARLRAGEQIRARGEIVCPPELDA